MSFFLVFAYRIPDVAFSLNDRFAGGFFPSFKPECTLQRVAIRVIEWYHMHMPGNALQIYDHSGVLAIAFSKGNDSGHYIHPGFCLPLPTYTERVSQAGQDLRI